MTIKKYAVIAGEDVFSILSFNEDESVNPNAPRLVAGFSSDPKIVEIDPESFINVGWTWDGSNFNPPGE
jgi:hypothetical protein